MVVTRQGAEDKGILSSPLQGPHTQEALEIAPQGFSNTTVRDGGAASNSEPVKMLVAKKEPLDASEVIAEVISDDITIT